MLDTPAMRLGRLLHTIVLEPEEVLARYFVCDADRRTRAGKEEYAALLAAGLEIISLSEMKMAAKIAANVRSYNIFDHGNPEVSIILNREEGMLPWKCRIDWLDADNRRIVELKTTANAHPDAFSRQMYRMNWHLQAAWYIDLARDAGYDVDEIIFIALETTHPYPVGIYHPSLTVIRDGRKLYQSLLPKIDAAWRLSEWPSYGRCILDRPNMNRQIELHASELNL